MHAIEEREGKLVPIIKTMRS